MRICGYRLPDHTDLALFARTLDDTLGPVQHRLAVRALAAASVLFTGDRDQRAEVVARWSNGQLRAENVMPALDIPMLHAATFLDALTRHLTHPAAAGVRPVFDLVLSVRLVGDPVNPGHAYAILDSAHEEHAAALTALPGVREFHYWSNTDQPEHLDDAQWEERALTWSRVLRTRFGQLSWQPARTDLEIDILSTYNQAADTGDDPADGRGDGDWVSAHEVIEEALPLLTGFEQMGSAQARARLRQLLLREDASAEDLLQHLDRPAGI